MHTIICEVSSLSSIEFRAKIKPERPRGFFNASQRRTSIGNKIKRQMLNILFEHGEVHNFTLDGVSINPVTTIIQVSFLTQLLERKETAQGFHHEPNGDFKSVRV
jgi:hypothetical protein